MPEAKTRPSPAAPKLRFKTYPAYKESVRSGRGTVKVPPDSAAECICTRFPPRA